MGTSPLIEIQDGNVPEAWYPILNDLHEELEIALPGYFNRSSIQIKEKYGELRAYIDLEMPLDLSKHKHWAAETRIVQALATQAENRSAETCQQCGKAGRQHTVSNWVYTLCGKHELEAKRAAQTKET